MPTNNNLAAALAFNDEIGAYLFPIVGYANKSFICPKDFKWSEHSSNLPEDIKKMAEDFPNCAFGINLGMTGLTVLDVDQKEGGEDGVAKLKELQAQGYETGKTFKVKTPSGNGAHLYYWGAARTTNGRDTELGLGLDTRGVGGMVPAPGQDVPGKGKYRLVRDETILDLPDWVLEKTGGAKKARKKDTQDLGVEVNKPENIAKAVEYLQRAETVSEGCRDSGTYKVACAMHDYGLSQDMAEQLLFQVWVPRCNMGDWGLEEVVAKVESAYERASGAFGNADLSVHFQDVTALEEGTIPETEKKVRVPYLEKLIDATRSSGDIIPSEIKRREWLVLGRFLRGFVTVTISPGGVGKSTMSGLEALAVALDRGEQYINRKTYEAVPAWIYNLEDPQEELDRKIAAMAQHYHIDLRDIPHLYTTSGLTLGLTILKEGLMVNTRALDACKEFILNNRIALWVIDPLVKAHQVNENDNGAMDKLMSSLSRIAVETNCAIHLVHHTRKKNNDTGNGDADTARGASSVINAARVAHTLNGMGAKEAAQYSLGEDRRWYVRVDDAKANLTPPADKAEWFKRVSVQLPNGDKVGVLEYTDLSALIEKQDIAKQIMALTVKNMPSGHFPVQKMAELLDLSGEITKDDGTQASVQWIKKQLAAQYTNAVEQGGKVIQYEHGLRPNSGFHSSCKEWLVCEYLPELDSAIASGAVEACPLEKEVRSGKVPGVGKRRKRR
jgi:hypothetical protein